MVTLKQGKFYNDGEPMPLEIGNIDQINLIARYNEVRDEGVEAYRDYWSHETDILLCHSCVCGHRISKQVTVEEMDEAFTLSKGCDCGLEYVFYGLETDVTIMVRLKSTPKKAKK